MYMYLFNSQIKYCATLNNMTVFGKIYYFQHMCQKAHSDILCSTAVHANVLLLDLEVNSSVHWEPCSKRNVIHHHPLKSRLSVQSRQTEVNELFVYDDELIIHWPSLLLTYMLFHSRGSIFRRMPYTDQLPSQEHLLLSSWATLTEQQKHDLQL